MVEEEEGRKRKERGEGRRLYVQRAGGKEGPSTSPSAVFGGQGGPWPDFYV